MDDRLKEAQKLGEDVENKMLDFLMQYEPTQELKVCDVKLIAHRARLLAFDAIELASRR